MTSMIFVNLPVTDLGRSVAFYEAVGGRKEDRFSADDAACMVLSDSIFVMLLTHEKWSTFTDRQIPDAHQSAQVMLALATDNREAVDDHLGKASNGGGQPDVNPKQDFGFMYSRAYADPDGHIWEVFWMDQAAVEQGPEAFAAHMGGG